MANYEAKLKKDLTKASRIGLGLNAFFGFYFVYLVVGLLEGYEWIAPLQDSIYWILELAGIVLGVLYSLIRPKSLGTSLVIASNRIVRQNLGEAGEPAPFDRYLGLFFVLATLWLGFVMTEFSFSALFGEDGLSGAQRIFTSILNPEFSIIRSVVRAMVQTIFLAFIATALSLPASFIAGFLSARNLMRGSWCGILVYNLVRFILNFTRSVEPIIWAIIFSVWVGIGPYAGMLALMLHSVAALAKSYSEQIECIDQGPLEAIEATGANRLQVIWYAVVPQIVLPFLAFTIYRWDINVRMATIIGLVGGGGIGTLLMQYQGLAKWNEVGTIILVIALVVWIMDYLSARIREAIY